MLLINNKYFELKFLFKINDGEGLDPKTTPPLDYFLGKYCIIMCDN